MIAFLFILTLPIVILESRMEPFIVGGEDANIVNFPYAAYLGIECVDDYRLETLSWVCGASIINQYVILTAGHCLFTCTSDSLIVIYVGHENVMEGAVTMAYSFLVHENYSHTWIANDIALVKTKTPFTLDENISRVALMKDPPYEEEAKVAGWGTIDAESIQSTNILQHISQYVWKKGECISILQSFGNGTFCAAGDNKSSYVYIGDSGSALVVHGYIQIGIVSTKIAKLSRKVTIYTDVGYYYDWIIKSVRKIMCSKR